MIKLILYVVLGALVGAFGTKFILQRIDQQHRHARSVMTLLAFRQERLDTAAKAGHCADVATEHTQLVALQREIAGAFPKAFSQDEDFRKDADGLATALVLPAAPATAATEVAPATCPEAAAQSQKVSDACDTCHKTYDPA